MFEVGHNFKNISGGHGDSLHVLKVELWKSQNMFSIERAL